MCHEPTLVEGTVSLQSPEAPDIPHRVEGQEDNCLDCHGSQALLPYPENHAELETGACLFCHNPAEPPAEASTGDEDVTERLRISHPLEGREDCLFCHTLDGIIPFPATHEGRDVEKCTNCHEPEM
jgi:hypothetical protein